MLKTNGKKAVVILLALSCIVCGVILAATPPNPSHKMQSPAELDSLITTVMRNFQISPTQSTVNDILVDTSFSRKIFRIHVSSRFPKTLFHLKLHNSLYQYKIKTPARVRFPERDMDLYVYHQNTVLRTIRLITDTGLDSILIKKTDAK